VFGDDYIFGDDAARSVWERRFRKGVPDTIMKLAHRKPTQLRNALDLNDLCVPPGNRLEQLSGDRAGQYSIRVTDQGVCASVGKSATF